MGKQKFIFGIHPIQGAIEAGKQVEKVLIQKGLRSENGAALFRLIRENGINFQQVPSQKLNRLTGKNHQGFIAYLSPIEYQNIEEIAFRTFESGEPGLLLALDQVSDVRNFGAIARSAECFGANALLMGVKGNAMINDDAIKTSAGALMKIDVCRTESLAKSLKHLKDSGFQLVGCTEKSDKQLSDVDFSVPTCIIMGSEELGISVEVMRHVDHSVKIPMYGTTDSLNVSVSAGVALYEATQQRNKG